MEIIETSLIELVDVGYATMLTLMFNPTFDDEGLEHAPRFRRILPGFPTNRTIAQAHGPEPAKCDDEVGDFVGLDPVFDLDQYWAAIAWRLNGDDRLGPVI